MHSSESSNIELRHEHWSYCGTGHSHHSCCTHIYTTRPKGNETAKSHILNECADDLDGTECFEGQYHITLDSSVPPVVHSPRRVPTSLREPLKEDLDTLGQQSIIAKGDRPKDWVNSCVCVAKPNG